MPDVTTMPSTYDGWRSALQEGELALTQCSACERWQWYPLLACPRCGSDEWRWTNVEPTGVLFSWTRVIRPTVARDGLEPPYVIGLIDLPQADGARVLALAETADVEPAIGSRVALRPATLGADIVLWFGAAPSQAVVA